MEDMYMIPIKYIQNEAPHPYNPQSHYMDWYWCRAKRFLRCSKYYATVMEDEARLNRTLSQPNKLAIQNKPA
jgi:hypothetical protein